MLKKIKKTFSGGLHLTDGRDKLLTYDMPIERFQMPDSDPPMKYETEIIGAGDYKRQDILEILEKSRLVGMGGAGFPTYLKYRTDKEIQTVLINGAECEPYLTCDYRLMLECAPAVLNGILVLQKAAGARKSIICIEDNKKKAAAKLSRFSEGLPYVEICLLPTKYPQGGEKQLIQTVLGKEVPGGGLPADLGVIVSNVATAKAAADAVLGKKPPVSRVVTVTGAVARPGNFLTRTGTPIRELLAHCGGVTEKENMVILGGPMTGKCLAVNWKGEDIGKVTLTTSGIVVFPGKQWKVQPCIRCGACLRICPAGLAPVNIETAYLKEDWKICEGLYATECISCGCCSYVCPAKRELARHVTAARMELRKKKEAEAVQCRKLQKKKGVKVSQ